MEADEGARKNAVRECGVRGRGGEEVEWEMRVGGEGSVDRA